MISISPEYQLEGLFIQAEQQFLWLAKLALNELGITSPEDRRIAVVHYLDGWRITFANWLVLFISPERLGVCLHEDDARSTKYYEMTGTFQDQAYRHYYFDPDHISEALVKACLSSFGRLRQKFKNARFANVPAARANIPELLQAILSEDNVKPVFELYDDSLEEEEPEDQQDGVEDEDEEGFSTDWLIDQISLAHHFTHRIAGARAQLKVKDLLAMDRRLFGEAQNSPETLYLSSSNRTTTGAPGTLLRATFNSLIPKSTD